MRRYRRRHYKRRRRVGRGIPKVTNGKIYFGKGRRGGGGLSKVAARLTEVMGDAIGI